MRSLIPILTLCLAGVALADPPPASLLGPPLTGAEFDAYATGKTLTYSDGLTVWGQETYLPGREVIWAFAEGTCEFGRWREVAAPDGSPMVCFTYEGRESEVNCWQFFHGPRGLLAQFMAGGAPISELGQSEVPLSCGPMIGA